MSENILKPTHPLLFFFSRILILLGMVLVFMFISTIIGMFAARLIFGIDVLGNPMLLTQYETMPEIIPVLKFLQSIYTLGAFLIPALVFPRALQQWPQEFLHSNKWPSWKFFVLGLGIMIAASPFTSWLVEINENFHFPASMEQMLLREKEAEKMIGYLVKADSFAMFLINMLVVAVLPAICEEFFFRGVLMRFLMMCVRNKHLAIIVSAIAFSAVHWQFYGFLPRMALGVVLGYIAYYSGSLWPAIAAHFLNNGLALLSFYYGWNESELPFLSENWDVPVMLTIVSAVSTVLLIRVMRVQRYKSIWYNGE